MQKIFYIDLNLNSVYFNDEIKDINDFIENNGKIISVTPTMVHNIGVTVKGGLLVVADDLKVKKVKNMNHTL